MVESETPEQSRDETNARERAELNRCLILRRQPAAAGAVRRWWQRLALTPAEAEKIGLAVRPWSPGLRAVLRRSETPEAAAMTEGFRRLWYTQQKAAGDDADNLNIAAWACVAMLLAEVKGDAVGQSFAAEAGKEQGDTGEPVVSALRFQQLQESRSPEELVRRLRRVLAMLRGSSLSPVLLADDVLLWFAERAGQRWPDDPGKRLAFRWAEAYFGQVARYKSIDG
ncbi:type I-E CRISPR-associated protein Cse2/CasB [Salinisphaera orenii]|uniref:type I-E CRISPR-associated protein Cse2/CasB n=1 Tax=Salinisphaera orenii TaxID=856731 RepID=UPI000F49538D|nr:type I-E CRISPR-associated protein Cse2/CasB [Salinisphaera halophila]